jgi:pimeloyl-[acyl-carrier protein] methyl ester esterase
MSLRVEIFGQGEPLVLLHGWGMNGGIFHPLAHALAENFKVYCVNLPGHGGRDFVEPQSAENPLDAIVADLAAQFSEPISLCGWSLGGQIALHWAATFPQQINKLILIASTPCFTARDDWPYGMAPETLQQFAEELENNPAATLRRFLSLQVRGTDNERELLQRLRANLAIQKEPDLAALRTGLAILREADLRLTLAKIQQATLIIAGERDKLTPPTASIFMAENLPNAQLALIEAAAHAPFLSHQAQIVEQLTPFLKSKI